VTKLATLHAGESSVEFEVEHELVLVTAAKSGGRPVCTSYPTSAYVGITPEVVARIEMARYRARGFRVQGEGNVEIFAGSAGADWGEIQRKARDLADAFGCRSAFVETASVLAVMGASLPSDVLVIGDPGEHFVSRLDQPDLVRVAAALVLAHPEHLSLSIDGHPVPPSVLEATLANRTPEQHRALIKCGTYQIVSLDALCADMRENAEPAPF
jgi:hypothetical protein